MKARILSGCFFRQKPSPLAPEGADPRREKFFLTAARVFCPCPSYRLVNKPDSQDEKRHHQAFVGRRDSVTNDKTTNTKAGEAVPHRGTSFPYLCQSHRLVNKPGPQDEDGQTVGTVGQGGYLLARSNGSIEIIRSKPREAR